MEFIVNIVSVLVIVCMIGAMVYATKALQARKGKKDGEKKENLKKAGLFFVGYGLLNVLRLLLQGNLG